MWSGVYSWSPGDLILQQGKQVTSLKGFMPCWKLQTKCFRNLSSFPCPKYTGPYSTTAFSNTLIPADPTFFVILFSWIRMSMKQREGRWLVPVFSCCNAKAHAALSSAGLVGKVRLGKGSRKWRKSKVNQSWAGYHNEDKGNNNSDNYNDDDNDNNNNNLVFDCQHLYLEF